MPRVVQIEDRYEDPEVLGTQYSVKKNALFEISATIATPQEVANPNASGGGVFRSLLQSGGGGGGGGFTGCPEVSQYIPTDIGVVKAKILPKFVNRVRLYNPITTHNNLLIGARILKKQPLYKTTTLSGIHSLTSWSHKVIRNTADKVGIALEKYDINLEILRLDLATKNIYSDEFIEKIPSGYGDVVEIELESEFIYASSSSEKEFILSHNRKSEDLG